MADSTGGAFSMEVEGISMAETRIMWESEKKESSNWENRVKNGWKRKAVVVVESGNSIFELWPLYSVSYARFQILNP